MNKNMMIGAILVLLVVAGGTFLLKNQSAKQAPASELTENDAAVDQDTGSVEKEETDDGEKEESEKDEDEASENALKTFNINGSNFKFDMTEIKVRQGDKVKINFTRTQGFHDWVVDEFNAKTKQLGEGQTDSVEFIASKKGTFEYYCAVGSHRKMGMVGKLIVE